MIRYSATDCLFSVSSRKIPHLRWAGAVKDAEKWEIQGFKIQKNFRLLCSRSFIHFINVNSLRRSNY